MDRPVAGAGRRTSEPFLELLAREASPVEFEGPLIEARAAGASREAIEDLERRKLVALQVRSLLRHRARREAELSALFDTAGDLAALRDVDAVLDAIVRRARQLLNTDLSYMTLHDGERGDTYMRVTDGSVSAAFQRLRLPMGAGLGGLVAQSGVPYATADYFNDERFQHLNGIDVAVREEGLVGIIGVPMLLGGQVIGVLFAADRSPRPFAQEEVALLCSLAAHAAIAIDNARLLQETRTALEELSQANEFIRAHSADVERAAQAHDRMTDVVVRGGGVADVAAVVTDVLGGALLVLDADGRRLADVGAIGDLDDAEVGRAVASSRVLGRCVQRGDLWVTSVATGTETLGTLVLRTRADVTATDQRILERAALVTALLLLFQRSVTDTEARVRGELLDDIIAGRVADADGLARRARRLGVDVEAPHVVVVGRIDADDEGHRRRAAFWAASHAAANHGLAASRGAEIVLMLPGDQPGLAARQVAKELTSGLGSVATAGAAGPVGPEGIPAAFEEARRCADALQALGRTGEGAGAGELGFVGLLISDRRDVSAFVTQVIGPVLDYDSRRRTALIQTLRTYFTTGCSQSRTAEQMHIHVNTVIQRLDRVGRLLGEGWQDSERALEIQLALRLHALRSAHL
ncbi:hypothetical protein Misp01_21020 [Microtetraspora sp. NBRC 13810]|uniref:helix-turn-helix domain-containing protein n=1 Tax=Microtetraspora sp. NBRC 13810 TaxID=3030990 RepID=UPI0024A1BD10|nr:helix-turn-helix domain-containing protein [Microtetraspora sp. NBRC 13810]GLW06972.1 hypothetical protein Misp01_21020 [Microtetraspora sp. NBRC 13810]